MTTLVTGGTGFVGSHVMRSLVDGGEKPIAYDVVPNLKLVRDIVSKIEFVQGDILDLPLILETIKKYEVKKIIHLAYSPIDVSASNPYLGMEIDIRGTNNIFEAARILDLDRVVWTSSVSVSGPASYYGGESVEIYEESPTRPFNIYGADKVLNEFVSKFYCEKYNLDIICLRPPQIFGPGKPVEREIKYPGVILNLLVENSVLGKPFRIPYPPDTKFDWIYVKDVAGTCVQSCQVKKPKHNIFLIGGGPNSLQTAANYVKELIPNAKIEFGNEPTLGIVNRYSTARASKEIGFKIRYPLKEGIRDLIQYLKL